MPGLGTIINVALLIAGGLLGLMGGRFITPRIQDTLMKASGLCVLFIGLGGTMQKMLVIDGETLATTGTTMLIVSFALGSLIGEAINLEAAIENLGEWLKRKTGSEGDNEFTNAFVSTSLTVCIGLAWPRLHLLGPARCRIPGHDHAFCRRALPHHDHRSPQQPFACGLHAHLLCWR